MLDLVPKIANSQAFIKQANLFYKQDCIFNP